MSITQKFETYIIKNNMDIDAANTAIMECERVGYVNETQLVLAYKEAVRKQVVKSNDDKFKGFR